MRREINISMSELLSLALYPFPLTLSTLGKNSADNILKYFSYFFQKTGFDISMETICMKYQNLFAEKIKKTISVCPLLKILPRLLSVKDWKTETDTVMFFFSPGSKPCRGQVSFSNIFQTGTWQSILNIKPLPLYGQVQQTSVLWDFSYSSQKTGFNISYKLSPLEIICMKCRNLFSGGK